MNCNQNMLDLNKHSAAWTVIRTLENRRVLVTYDAQGSQPSIDGPLLSPRGLLSLAAALLFLGICFMPRKACFEQR